jgi:hypothetical protein
LFQKKIEKNDLDGVECEKIGLLNGKKLFGVMNLGLSFLIMIQEIGFGGKKMKDIK